MNIYPLQAGGLRVKTHVDKSAYYITNKEAELVTIEYNESFVVGGIRYECPVHLLQRYGHADCYPIRVRVLKPPDNTVEITSKNIEFTVCGMLFTQVDLSTSEDIKKLVLNRWRELEI